MSDFRADLHCHSHCSDGTDTPEQLIDLAIEKGLSGLSITDHDTLDAYDTVLTYAAEKNFPLLPGIELSAVLGEEPIHILSYGFPITSEPILELCALHKRRRHDRNMQILERLQELGIDISMGDLPARTHTVGRPHIALALMEKGVVSSVKEAFDRFLGEGKKAYAPGERVSVERTIDAIHAGGGLAILAHPHLIRRSRVRREVLNFPFDGVEGYYARIPPNQEAHWVKVGKERGWIITGGSDYHGTIKPQNFLGTSWVGEETFQKLYDRYLKTL